MVNTGQKIPADGRIISALNLSVEQAALTGESISSRKRECVEKESLNCANEPELSYECTTEYQDWAVTNCPGWEEEQFCGGITGRVCPEGYSCKLDGNYPDAGGVCTKLIEQIPPISKSELLMGWYYGTKDQKKKNTPTTWVYTEAGKSSCWHKINTQCRFLPD